MTPCDAGDIVLVRFPFTDLSSSRKRPALVISPAAYSNLHGDVALLALTSQPQADQTWVKPLIGTLSQNVILKNLGRVAVQDHDRVKDALVTMISPDFLT
jgi:PemK-like, MazF-like toxin of type II toxin-antitoxin system